VRRAAERALLLAALTAVAGVVAPAAGGLVEPGWGSRLQSAERYADRRAGRVSFALIDQRGRFHGYRPDAVVHAASLLKPMLLVAYVREPSVRSRPLTPWERSVLDPMIRRSNNAAAETMIGLVGGDGLRRVARLARMTDFRFVPWHWGHSETTARDQARFFYRIQSLLPRRHRTYALGLLERIVPSQRWGFGRIEHPGWRLYFKGGWSEGTGRVDHQAGLLTSGSWRVALAVTIRFNPSHSYGKRTLRGLAERLVARLPAPFAEPRPG
jgi:Beta-lactamase enzyme family